MVLLIGQSGTGLTFLTWSLAYLSSNKSERPGLYYPQQDGSFHDFQKEKHYRGPLPLSEKFAEKDILFWNPNHQKHLDNKPQDLIAFMVTVKNSNSKRWLFNRNWRCVPNWIPKRLHQDLCDHHSKTSVDRAFFLYWKKYIDYIDYNRGYPNVKTLEIDEIFQELDQHIQELCNYFCLGFDHQRIDSWMEVYHAWKDINLSFKEEQPVVEIMSAERVIDTEVKVILRKLMTCYDI